MSQFLNEKAVELSLNQLTLRGDLSIPKTAHGLVIFAHGSGSSRFSPRNRFVSNILQQANLATLLIDLLTEEEEELDAMTAHLRFDIGLLAERLMGATQWALKQPETQSLKLGYFGASTGAGAALVAAANLPEAISAVVSRGGRPDLAGIALSKVKAPTLLIVGGKDEPVIHLNEEAAMKMTAHKELVIVPGATHLFEEPGTLQEVARLATEWFQMYLTPVGAMEKRPDSGYL